MSDDYKKPRIWRTPNKVLHLMVGPACEITACGHPRREERWPDGFCTRAGWQGTDKTIDDVDCWACRETIEYIKTESARLAAPPPKPLACAVCGWVLTAPETTYVEQPCPSCGTLWGRSLRPEPAFVDAARQEWVAAGAHWWSTTVKRPLDWGSNLTADERETAVRARLHGLTGVDVVR